MKQVFLLYDCKNVSGYHKIIKKSGDYYNMIKTVSYLKLLAEYILHTNMNDNN